MFTMRWGRRLEIAVDEALEALAIAVRGPIAGHTTLVAEILR